MDHEVTIFEEAVGIASGQAREAYLRGACAGNGAMLERLQGLLRVHDRAGKFMEHEGTAEATNASAGTGSLPLSEQSGDRIGRYKLLQKIGEGGCGVVYMAEQEEPVRRRVALKIIKLGMDTRQVIARFEAERQALALMDHPNIAKVHDAGATETGRPYFVMELVRGLKITEYCDEQRLTTSQRLGLFIQVCQAIQHAHQKGIIHRDIKPSNILVTVNDGVAVPKVIDFGIAKATTGQQLTNKTLFTAFEQFIGTPAYMSPEQAVLTSLDIDTRSDIYALGVLLYELLTGKTPFDTKQLLAIGLDEMRRTIREVEPPKPSTRVSTLPGNELGTTAHRRRLESPHLVSQLQGDLDWIVMKAMDKDRSRRYETANGLAADIQRHLGNEPVVARPPSNLYRFQKLIQRNKVMAFAAALVILALFLGVTVSTWQAVRATRAEREQSRLLQRAQQAQANEAGERSKAEKAAGLEAEQRARAQAFAEENRINLYAARIKLAEQTFRNGDVARVLELLESLRPLEGQQDLRSFDWYYLWQLCHSERLVCRNWGRVVSTAFSPDGRLLAFAGEQGIIRLCDAASGTNRAELTNHAGRIGSVAFCPDGRRIASAGEDGTVRLWDVSTGEELRKLQIGTNPISALTFSADGTLLAAGEGAITVGLGNPGTRFFPYGSAGGVAIWNTINFQLERRFQGDSNGVLSLAFSADGRKLAFSSGRRHHSVQLYDVAANRELASRTNFQGFVVGLAFGPEGRELIAGDWHPWHDSGQIVALDPLSLEPVRIIVPDAGRLLCIAPSPDGKRIAGAGVDQVARLWDYTSGDEVAAFYGHVGPIASLAFTPDSRGLATAGWDNKVRVWNLETSPARGRIETFQAFSVAFSPDGKWLASAGSGAEVRETASGRLVRALTEFTNTSDGHVAFAPDGSHLAAAEIDGTLHIWNAHTWKHYVADKDPAIPEYSGWPYPGTMLSFSPDGQSLVEGFGRSIPIWNVDNGKLADIITNDSVLLSLAFAPDAKNLLVGSDTRISLLNLATKKSVSFPSSCGRLAVSDDGQWAASAQSSSPNNITLRNLSDLKIRARWAGHQDAIYSLAFSHDGRLLASGSWDGTVRIWQIPTGNELLSIPSLSGIVWSVAFAPDDRTLAFGSGSGSSKRGGAITVLRAATDTDVSRARRPARIAQGSHSKLLASIPNRPENCPANLIDLSDFYNGTFQGWGFTSKLTLGIQTLGGVEFELRGIIQLDCMHPEVTHELPASARGIQVRRRCQALHFLHAATWAEEGGTTIGEYVIHSAGGRQARVPLVFGENIINNLSPSDEPPFLGPATRLAWRGESAISRKYGGEMRFYDFRWQNPHPESEIESIDLESSLTLSGPVLLAITAEE